VQDRPAPVSNVQISAIGDRSLTLSWTPGAFNNSAITGFEVTMSSAATGAVLGTTQCSTTVCAITTPGNGRANAVTLAVRARNALGLSDPTSYVEPVWSDVVPNAPANVNYTPLNNGLRITWNRPADAPGASPITSYVVTVGGITNALQVSPGDSGSYALNVVDASIANGVSIGFSIASRNDFYQGRTTWNQTSGSGVPAGAPLLTGTAPAATPNNIDGSSATLTWPNVFTPNGKSVIAYYAGVFQGGAQPGCSVTGVESGQPVLHVDPTSSTFQQVQGGSATFSGLSANQTYNFVVYAYNGQGCTPSTIVSATQRQQPGPVRSVRITGPAQNLTNTWDFQASVDYQNGSGSSPIVNYQLVGDNGVVENGQLSGTSGMVAGGNGAHYGTGLTLSITSICETYPDGSQLCSPQNYTARMGVAVSTAIGDPRFDPTTSIFSWTSWPTGSGYTAVTYSCGNGPEAPMPPVGQTATCQAPPGAANPSLTVTVRVGSDTYTTSYPASGMP
jgi:large repetitive protein